MFSVTISDFSEVDIGLELEVDDADINTPYVTLEDVEQFKMEKCSTLMDNEQVGKNVCPGNWFTIQKQPDYYFQPLPAKNVLSKRRSSLNACHLYTKSSRSTDDDIQERGLAIRGRSSSFSRIRGAMSLFSNKGLINFDELRSCTNSTLGTGDTLTEDDFASMIGDDAYTNTKGSQTSSPLEIKSHLGTNLPFSGRLSR